MNPSLEPNVNKSTEPTIGESPEPTMDTPDYMQPASGQQSSTSFTSLNSGVSQAIVPESIPLWKKLLGNKIARIVVVIVGVNIVGALTFLGLFLFASGGAITPFAVVEQEKVAQVEQQKMEPTEVLSDPAKVENGKVVNDCYSFTLPSAYALKEGSTLCGLTITRTGGSSSGALQIAPATLAGADNIIASIKKSFPIETTTTETINGNEVIRMSYTSTRDANDPLKMKIVIIMDSSAVHLKKTKTITGYMITGQASFEEAISTMVGSFTIQK